MTPIAPDVPAPSTFGPPLRNFDTIEDPETDMDASAWNLLRTQVAAMALTSPKALVTFSISGGTVTVLHHASQWGSDAGSAPSVVRDDAGVYDITWLDEYSDIRDDGGAELHAFAVRSVHVTCDLGATARRWEYERTASATVRVTVYDPDDITDDADEVTVVVW